jgi:hypothetical protein
MNLLVITSEPISADQLREALDWTSDLEDIHVMLVVPALQENAMKFWLSDADDAISRAERVRREAVAELGAEGVAAYGDTGESDVLDAIADALQTFDADRIALFTHPPGDQRYREAVDPSEVQQRFGLPVDQALITA